MLPVELGTDAERAAPDSAPCGQRILEGGRRAAFCIRAQAEVQA